MKQPKAILWLAAVICSAMAANAGLVSINLTNVDGPRQILAGESTGVIDATGWVNFNTAASLSTNNVAGTVVDVVASKAVGTSNTARDKGSGDGTDGFLALYEAGLRDASGATAGDTYVTISDMTSYLTAEGDTSYRIIAYYKAPVTSAARGLEIGLATDSLVAVTSPDYANVSVNDSFVEADNADSNYIVFNGLTADSTTVYLNRTDRDGMLTGIQIQTIPEPATIAMVGLFGAGLMIVRRKLSI